MGKVKTNHINNHIIYMDYLNRLSLIAKSLYKWENLPNGISERWIEEYLYNHGKCLFFKDENNGFMVTNYTENGMVNMYNEPVNIRPFATNYNGTQRTNHIDATIIRGNSDTIPTRRTLEIYAKRLAEITRTIDINVKSHKTPYVILCDEKQKLTMKNVLNQIEENETAIFGSKNLDIESIKVLKTDSPIVFDKLEIEKKMIWNEVMTFLGVNNANQDKRERLVADEVQANNGQVSISAELMLKSRQEACEEINKLWGLDIKVTPRNFDKTNVNEEKGGDF